MKHDELTELFKEHYNPLLLYMLSLSKNRVVSEDIVSEAFFKALMSSDAEIVNFRTWSFRVCRNLYFNHLRKSRRLTTPQDESVADGRKAAIDEMIDEYQVDGVIEIILQACHTYNIESHYVKQTVTNKGKSYLMIETDYSQADKGQIRTRLEAFLETLEK